MAVNLIPAASEELKEVLLVRDQIARLEEIIASKQEELHRIRPLIEKYPVASNFLKKKCDGLVSGLKKLSKELENWKRLKREMRQLCGYCNGSQRMGQGMMVEYCTLCDGSGFARDYKKIEKKREKFPTSIDEVRE